MPLGDSIETLLANTKLSSNGSCKLWLGGTMRKGYGLVRRGSEFWATHRLVYFLLHGPIPQDKQIMHMCNSPKCINPDHLILGSNSDNQAQRGLGGRYNNKLGVVGITYEKVGAYERYTARGTRKGNRVILYRGPSFENAVVARQQWEKENALFA